MPHGILTPCNVVRSYDIDFVRWLHHAVGHVALESWQWIHQVAAPCNVIRGSGITCHWIRPNVRHIGIQHLVSISTHHRSRHVILYQSAKFYPNRSDHHASAEKMTSCRYSRWRISAILDCRNPIMGSLKSPVNLHNFLWGTLKVDGTTEWRNGRRNSN